MKKFKLKKGSNCHQLYVETMSEVLDFRLEYFCNMSVDFLKSVSLTDSIDSLIQAKIKTPRKKRVSILGKK